MVTHETDMAAYARRMVTFVDGRIAQDVVNANPVTGPQAEFADGNTSEAV
jgi:putative ABC transport system ATP-binding protein